MSGPWLTRLICAALVAATFAVYWPVRTNDFINYDDQEYVTQNSHVLAGLSWQGVVWAFTTVHSANWHPLTWLSHMLDCTLYGLNPAGHHLTNVLIHALNSALLFSLLKQATDAFWRSLLVAALFALHPLHVESVAWVAERKDVLSAFFGLLCLRAYVCHAQETDPAVRQMPTGICYTLAVVFFALGLLCKPMLVSFPFVLLLLDFWPLRRHESSGFPRSAISRRLLVEKIPFFMLAGVSSLVTWQAQHAAMNYYRSLPLELRLGNAIISYARYLGKMFWPTDLAIVYPYPAGWAASEVVLAATLLVLISVAALAGRRGCPFFAFGWSWFVVMMLPVIGLVQVGVQAMADRYTYLPLIGLFVVIAWGLGAVVRRLGAGAGLAAIASFSVIVACAIVTRAQLRFWASTETIFTRAIAVTRDNWVAHYNLALRSLADYQQERYGGAAKVSGRALRAGRRDYLEEVVVHCEAAVKANPGFPDPYVTLGKALTERGELEAARATLQTAIRLDARNPDSHENLAEIAYRQGRVQEALTEYRAALALRPKWEAVLNNLAWVLATYPEEGARNGPQAVQLAEQACRLTGYTNLSFLHTLAAAHAETGSFTNAVSSAQAAADLARTLGDSNLQQTAARRLELYQRRQPLRASP